MRPLRSIQATFLEFFAKHQIGRELKRMSDWLDQHPQVITLVAVDLRQEVVQPTGREGLSAESVLRCALLKQHRQLSYEELAFHLEDSASFQAFARLPLHWTPKKSMLHETVSAIRGGTWEKINQVALVSAARVKVETGKQVRVDSTATGAPIHEPSDSSLLWDGMRVMVRLLEAAEELPGAPALNWRNHSLRAKRRAFAILYSRKPNKRVQLYRDLVKVTRKTIGYLQAAYRDLSAVPVFGNAAEGWYCAVNDWLPLVLQVVSQTERRVFKGEKVPAEEKLFSLFETHTDIIKKGGREVHYGHKLNLTMGKSGMILDVVIERGNPADSDRLLPMLDRHIAFYGFAPRQMAADGGYASADNLAQAKARGVEDMAFNKKRGLKIEDMVRSKWVYRKLRNFRAGIEAGISCLKRAYGLSRCTWKGLAHFESYVWSSVVAYNLALLTRLKPA